ncbi:hypothetical protein NSP_46580 [Nodularia spumigena CCY9414]|nr:hypothetical protein NSP_46580 [Nodularia spumigena CCY9414]
MQINSSPPYLNLRLSAFNYLHKSISQINQPKILKLYN